MNRGSQPIKSFNVDPRSKNRIKFQSSKQRAKKASADVYRTYKRRFGVTSAATREELVHHQDESRTSRKKRKTLMKGGEAKAIIVDDEVMEESEEEEEELELETNSTFAMELDLAKSRNASILFSKLYRSLVPLVGSLPEILHHAKKIVTILLSYVLSHYTKPSEATPDDLWMNVDPKKKRDLFVVNIVTTDVLHLLSVLARDLRHEIHPYVHSLILPRIVHDLINPPTTVADPEMKQQRTLDIVVIETAFRTLSYVFRYDADEMLSESAETPKDEKKKFKKKGNSKVEGCLEPMRKYYGAILAHKTNLVRRLGAESFAPLIRKLKSNTSKKKHVRRVIRSLASSAAVSAIFTEEMNDDDKMVDDCYEPEVTATSNAQRASNDAIDGVAFLLFYAARGVPGRLHSKSQSIIKIALAQLFPLEKSNSEQNKNVEYFKRHVTFILVTQVFGKMRAHVRDGKNFAPAWNEMYSCLETVIEALNQGETDYASSLGYLMQIMTACVNYRNGKLVKSQDGTNAFEDSQASTISKLLHKVLDAEFYSNLGKLNQSHVLGFLCSSWKMFPDHPRFANDLCRFVPTIAQGSSAIVDPILILAKDLLPHLPRELASNYLAPEILKAAAKRGKTGDSLKIQIILHAVATSRLNVTLVKDDYQDDKDDLFITTVAKDCSIQLSAKNTLVNLCIKDLKLKSSSNISKYLPRISYIARIVPFLAFVGCDATQEENFALTEKIWKSISDLLKRLDKIQSEASLGTDVIVTKAILLEALACIASEFVNSTKNAIIKNFLQKVCGSANKFLSDFPSSLMAVKAVAEIANIMKLFDLQLNDKANETFDAISSNLRSDNHFMRLHTLRVLSVYPQKPYVTDFSEIDLSEDLDEDYTQTKHGSSSPNTSTSKLSGVCDIIDTLLQIETIPVELKNERRLTGAINRIEVLGRTGKLPAQYAEVATNLMFGIMNIKFRPIWNVAVQAIIALTSCHEITVWPIIEDQLRLVMQASFFIDNRSQQHDQNVESDEVSQHQNLFLAWNNSSGADAKLFGHQISAAQSRGMVSRHHSTDRITVFEHVWSVLEGVPQLTTKKSRVIVPIFLQFLDRQYYVFHNDDPDKREFELGKLVEVVEGENESSQWSKENLSRKTLQKKIVSFLKMFAKVKGMSQLYKHKLLLVIFGSFLTNPDAFIAQLSLDCIFRFNLPYIKPYTEQLKGMLTKGDFRETLTKFNVSQKEGMIDNGHREQLVPYIIRILFGRLASRGNGSKSSKDSPAVRRAAILSFLSGLRNDTNELDYFIYMMVRSFIPPDVNMSIVESGHGCKSHVQEMISIVSSRTSVKDLSNIHSQRQEGILNLLSEVIKKLGFGIVDFIPVFMRLILVMLENAELQRKESSSNIITDSSELNREIDISLSEGTNNSRAGKIRTLCFLRISDMMGQFSEAFNFHEFSKKFWKTAQPSLNSLPGIIPSTDNSPSLLVLLETISSHHSLIRLLKDDESSVEAAFKCISESSKDRVMDSALNFVDNLLTEGGLINPGKDDHVPDCERIGLKLIRNKLDLLLGQFTRRLKNNEENYMKTSQLASRELDILCRVSFLLADEVSGDEKVKKMLVTLCELLIPFLHFGCRIGERSQLNVLSILATILPRIGYEAAYSHLQSLSRLLGPDRSNHGIRSLEVRSQIVQCIDAIALNDGPMSIGLKLVANAMKDLNAHDRRKLDEWDFDRVLPILNGLGNTEDASNSWLSNSKDVSLVQSGLKILAPLMYCCLHLLYDPDGVLSRGALKALKNLVYTSSKQCGSNAAWLWLMEHSMMATIRVGLKTRSAVIRRSFILLLSDVVRRFSSHNSPTLCSDLVILIRDDNIDLDFFLNITHVQIHRRSRALSRVRKLLLENEANDDKAISAQSLTNVLLPLALHPVYECTKGEEEGYALEAVATIGVICKNLPWGKYQNALWNALTQLPNHESQERYLVAMICAIIDSFHFEVSIVEDNDVQMNSGDSSTVDRKVMIWKQLSGRFIPKIQSYLMKETMTRKGSKDKVLRSPIALALTKLFQKLPQTVFDNRFPRLLTTVCNTLRDRESDTRDVARKTLAKIATTIDIKYLADIVRELALALNEGYKLFVRSATLHSVLLAISDIYQRPDDPEALSTTLPFDSCVPAMMDIIQQDIFGAASEIKAAEATRKRLVKEASGSKSYSSLELISRMILFKPSLHASGQSFSGIHALVNPFLERLRDPEVTASTIGKVRECMGKIVSGISNNSSSTSEEMLPFVYATVAPFILTNEVTTDDEDDDSDEEEMNGLEISRSQPKKEKISGKNSKRGVRKVFNWAPSQLKSASDSRSAYEMKIKDKIELRKVQDGANAPKLTGSSRYETLKSKSDINSPAISCAVSFGLTLLHAHLKRNKASVNVEMSDPYVKILSYCVQGSKDNDAVLLSLKCLQVLLYLDLPSITIYRKDLARSILRILSSLSCNTQNEMVQGCFKTLTLLLAIDRKSAIKFLSDDDIEMTGTSSSDEKKIDPILSKSQMQVLMSILQSALTDAEHHNATFGIIKAITSRKYVSPDFYDLMDIILKMTVQSQKPTMRQQASKIFMQYLIEYPMGKPRLETHLKQIILNIKYEYDDGRISALGLLNAVINKLPLPLLEEYTQLFFLPLVLQLVNDESNKCRESVGLSISTLLSRLSKQVLQSLYEYAIRWSEDAQGGQLQRMSVQLFGLFVDTRTDFMKKNDRIHNLVAYLSDLMQKEIGNIDHTSVLLAKEWEMMYFCLQTIEKVGSVQQKSLYQDTQVWEFIIKGLVHPHPWVQLLASRIIFIHFSPCKLEHFSKVIEGTASSILFKATGSLFEIARNLCFQLNSDDDQQAADVTTMAIKNLSWIVKVMDAHPALCYRDEKNENLDTDDDDTEDIDESKELQKSKPTTWLVTRLSNIAKKHGNIRREAVFKCIAAIATVADAQFVIDHLEIMLAPIDRVIVENEALQEIMANKASGKRSRSRSRSEHNHNFESLAALPKEIMQLLEDKCGTEEFMQALTSVKSRARDKRMERKQRVAAEKVHDPESAAKHKLERQEMKKKRKKRKVEAMKKSRGVL